MTTDNPSQVMEAIEGFVTDIDDERYIVNAKTTRVAADHVLVKRFPQHFRPVEADLSFRTEEATANPGETRNRPVTNRPIAPKTTKET